LDKNQFDLSELRKRLDAGSGKDYWRSLEELAETEEFQQMLQNEFPEAASEWSDDFSRRGFLKLLGATFALAGLSACTRQPIEKIVPYVRQPEEILPGKPLFFASGMTLSGVASALLVESNMGRPTKVEGNPLHPQSAGATDRYSQASILGLYDPDRSQAIIHLENISSWTNFLTAFRGAIPADGDGLRILTETISSPSLGNQLQQVLKRLPRAKWYQYEPAGRDNARVGSKLAFGQYVETQYRIDQADVILSLDSDFLDCGPASLRYVRDFAHRRNPDANARKMNRLYAIEATPTNTGAVADHRLAVRASEVASHASLLLKAIHGSGGTGNPWLDAAAIDLQMHRGSCVVIPGDYQSPEVHAIAHAINDALGNAGKTVLYTDSIEVNPVNQQASLKQLVGEMNAGKVQLLLILGGNPVYNAPSDFQFADALQKVNLKVHLGLYYDETSYLCHWHLPEAHFLESWGDARSYEGTITLAQPLIAPLYSGKTPYEVLAILSGQPQQSNFEIVQAYWKQQHPGADFEDWWRKSLHDGFIANSALPSKAVSLQGNFAPNATAASSGIEIILRPDPNIYDGRFANNAWLQELPRPLTKHTWDNAAFVSPATAEKMQLQNEDVVQLHVSGNQVFAPVLIWPGHPDDAVTVHLGFGRTRMGHVAQGVGFDAYRLRTSQHPWVIPNAEISKIGEKYPIATTQNHFLMENRHLVRSATLAHYLEDPAFVRETEEQESPQDSLYPAYKYDGYKWGMAIDLNACVGCNACVLACQSENNIAVVGKDQVKRGREMHWLRIDRYYSGELERPETYFQPVPCMHCENAPCEVVCPVNATVHSPEGLNEMIYNRCVGTRYCSNNCPYKVRRFNFLLYSDWNTPSLKLMRNPDVTVRSRGVMEKCTYCVQRIQRAKIEAEKQDRTVRDGEIVTACQQACPAEAIVFGDINDPNSKVSKLKSLQRNYGILTELNTRPRTTYLGNLKNPNPELTTDSGARGELEALPAAARDGRPPGVSEKA
jgi:MoCo/4Fe-4S cofactor protein with predicted Tat translocation signal